MAHTMSVSCAKETFHGMVKRVFVNTFEAAVAVAVKDIYIYILEYDGRLEWIDGSRERRKNRKSEGLGCWKRDSFCGCSIPTVFNQRWIF